MKFFTISITIIIGVVVGGVAVDWSVVTTMEGSIGAIVIVIIGKMLIIRVIGLVTLILIDSRVIVNVIIGHIKIVRIDVIHIMIVIVVSIDVIMAAKLLNVTIIPRQHQIIPQHDTLLSIIHRTDIEVCDDRRKYI